MSEQGTYQDNAEATRRSTLQRVEGYIFGSVFAAIILVGGYFLMSESGKRKKNDTPPPPVVATPDALIGYKAVGAWETDLATIWGVAIDPDGNVWACGKGGLRKFTNDGTLLESRETDGIVRTMTFMPNGSYYLAIQNRVEFYNAQGVLQGTWNDLGDNANITSIVIQGDRAFLGDVGSTSVPGAKDKIGHDVIVTDLQGNIQKRFGSMDDDKVDGLHITGPHLDLAWHNDLLWVTNPGRHAVQAYTAEGEKKAVVGRQSFRHIGFTGCCNPSSLAVLPDGRVVTTEKGMPRVKLINPEDGEFLTYVAPEDEWRKRSRKHAYAVDLAVYEDGRIFIADKKETGKQLVTVYAPKPEGAAPAAAPETESEEGA